MKCTIIIFSFDAVLTESDLSKHMKCFQQSHVLSIREESCRDEKYLNYNSTLIENEFRTVITQYSGDNSEFQRVIDKYCPIVGQVVDCTLIGLDVDDDCVDQRSKLRRQQEYKIFKGLLNYACSDSGAAMLPLLQNNIVKSILENDEFGQCIILMYGDSDEPFRRSIVTCDGIDKTFECLRDHANSNLVQLANDVRVMLRQAIKCQPENDL